ATAKPLRETAQVTVPGDEAVAMPDLEHVAVTVAPSLSGDDAVPNGPYRRTEVGRIVGAFVLAPASEHRMLASTEYTADTPKLERRTQKRRAHRLARLIEVLAAHRPAREMNRVDDRARELERGRDNLSDPHRAAGRDGTLGDHPELVSLL